jgi:hypothetical protein
VTMVADRWPDARAERAYCCFLAWRGMVDAWQRQEQIDALPVVAWRGRTLRTLTCMATSGKGPHAVNVPEALLWALIDLRAFRCPYHT